MTHRHVYDVVPCVELAPDVCIRPTFHGGAEHIRSADGSIAGGPDEHLAGFLIGFEMDGNEYRLEGGVNVDPHFSDRPIWTVTGSLEGGDLTLNPSVHMQAGGGYPERHGWVRDAKWVQA